MFSAIDPEQTSPSAGSLLLSYAGQAYLDLLTKLSELRTIRKVLSCCFKDLLASFLR